MSSSFNRSSRDEEPYEPPVDVQNTIQNIAKQVFGQAASTDSWLDISLEDQMSKFKFLQLCFDQIKYQVSNADLFEMKSVKDVVAFYQKPVAGTMPYQALLRSQDKGQLPSNLRMIEEPHNYDPNETSFMGGIDAFPGLYFPIRGVRNRRRAPKLKQKIHWPDI